MSDKVLVVFEGFKVVELHLFVIEKFCDACVFKMLRERQTRKDAEGCSNHAAVADDEGVIRGAFLNLREYRPGTEPYHMVKKEAEISEWRITEK